MKTKLTIFAVFSIALLISGCSAVSNLRLNEELTNLYSAKIDAKDSEDVILQETVAEALNSLAIRAETLAKQSKEPVDAISFYRIAATAAWQGRSENVADLSEEGWKICDDSGVETAPRDCMMLLVIPDLAATDALTMRLEKANQEVRKQRSLPDEQQSATRLNELKEGSIEIFDSLANRFKALGDSKAKFSAVSVPPPLAERMNTNLNFIFCQMRVANGTLLVAAGDEDPGYRARKKRLEEIRVTHDPNNQINCAT